MPSWPRERKAAAHRKDPTTPPRNAAHLRSPSGFTMTSSPRVADMMTTEEIHTGFITARSRSLSRSRNLALGGKLHSDKSQGFKCKLVLPDCIFLRDSSLNSTIPELPGSGWLAADPERGEPHLWGRPQTHSLRPWGFPTVSPSHPSVFSHHGIQRITVEFSEKSPFFRVFRRFRGSLEDETIEPRNRRNILPRQQRRSYTNPKRERGIRCVSLAGASG